MKKLLFSILFAVGAFISIEAQTTLSFLVKNTSNTDTWAFRVADGSGQLSQDLNIGPGGQVGLNPATMPNFVFPLTWSAQNLTTGCSSGGQIFGYGGAFIPFACGAAMQYSLQGTGLISTTVIPATALLGVKLL